jgi:hypothetical protein
VVDRLGGQRERPGREIEEAVGVDRIECAAMKSEFTSRVTSTRVL